MTDTSTVTVPLDVLDKYNSLVRESIGPDSVYIRTKETVEEMVSNGSLDDVQKAEILSKLLGSALGNITSSSMSAALEWAKYEKELALKKLELDQQLLILDQEKLLKEAQVDQIDVSNRMAQVESKRMFGTATFDVTTGAITSLANDGKVWNDMKLVEQQLTNAAAEEILLGSKVDESKAAIHKVVADTFVNYGSYTFTQNSNGISGVTATHGAHVTLSDTQKEIAIEQGKGYTYNAWANALTGSASMLGTVVASGDFSFNAGSNELRLFDAVVLCAENLKAASSAANDAVPTAT